MRAASEMPSPLVAEPAALRGFGALSPLLAQDWSLATALSLLVWYIYAPMCISTLATIKRETNSWKQMSFATVYLSPRDYHRVHMPLAGRLTKMSYVPGDLYSVNQQTAEGVPNLFSRNERLVCLFDTELGPMAVVLVGAMIVAGIETVWAGRVCPGRDRSQVQVTDYTTSVPPVELAVGAELGRFYLGSTAIVLFGHGAVELSGGLSAESPVRMGQLLGLAQQTNKAENLGEQETT